MGTVKGFTFTFSTFLLAAALLFLAVAIASYSNSLKEGAYAPANFERLNAQFDSAEYGMQKILEHTALNITLAGTNMSFEGNLTGTYSNYSQGVSRFGQFLENYAEMNVTVNLSGAQGPAILVEPGGISVNRTFGRLAFSPSSSANITGYTAFIWINQSTPRFNWTNATTAPPSSPGALRFIFAVQGTNGTASRTVYLNRSAYSVLNLLNSQNQTIFAFQFNSTARMAINSVADMHIKVIMELNTTASAELGSDAVKVNVPGEAEKTGRVMIIEG